MKSDFRETVKKEKIDYRHYISVGLTLVFIAFGIFVFPNAICRLYESVRDLVTSFMFVLTNDVTPTVTELPSLQITSSKFSPLRLLPFTFDEFSVKMGAYFSRVFSWTTLQNYFEFLGKILFFVFQAVVLIVMLYVPLYNVFSLYLRKQDSKKGDKKKKATKKARSERKKRAEKERCFVKESKYLKFWKRFYDNTFARVKLFVMKYKSFLKSNPYYLKIWKWTWLFNFNFIAIVIEFLAYYIYFLRTFDLLSLYRQVYKLLLDLTAVVRFVPLVAWIIVFFVFTEKYAWKCAYRELWHRERKNRGMFRERSVVSGYAASMGKGKTLSMTARGLSEEVNLRDLAFEVIVECDFAFPFMTWSRLEKELKTASAYHVVYDVHSIRRWMWKKYRRWLKSPCRRLIFGYDYERYGLLRDDKLKVESVWQVMEDYACAYFIYSVQCSLLITSYSVRSDELKIDLKHFPLWNHDFFKRDARYMDAYSRRSHIMDFDMLRWGKKMLKNNPNAHALGFGVYLFTEFDKEQGNALSNQEMKALDEKANPKNDLTNITLKLIRHAVTIRNRRFIVIIYDLQRAEDWGVNGRGVGEVLEIVGETAMRPVLPFWSLFWVFEMLYYLIFNPFVDLYYRYRHVRDDDTAVMHGLHGLISKIKNYYDGVCNTFGSKRLTLEVQDGRLNGEKMIRYQYISSKKDLSERYETACFENMFARFAEKNEIGIADLRCYADKLAREDELRAQHSYMQERIFEFGAVA